MPIDAKNIQAQLAARFIELMDSKRGTPTILAKSIGKPASYFSAIKRGNPVNSLHLVAVGKVFGAEMVIKLLRISENEAPPQPILDQDPEVAELLEMTRQIIQSDTSYASSLTANIRSFHQAMVMEGRYQNLEKRIADLESDHRCKSRKQAQPDDRRRGERRAKNYPELIPESGDRRTGEDRRKTVGEG